MTKPDPPGPISAEDVTKVIEASGYPFEYQVFEKLRSLLPQFEPIPGYRSETGRNDGTTKEIDIVVDLAIDVKPRGKARLANTALLVEAKRLKDAAFVAFLPPEPLPGRRKFVGATELRLRFVGGFPHWGLFGHEPAEEEIRTAVASPGGLAGCFGPLHVDRVCHNWVVCPRPTGNNKNPKADQPPFWSDDIVGMLRASAWQAKTFTEITYDTWAFPPTDFAIMCPLPLLVVDGPIFVYDVPRKTATQVQRVTLNTAADTVLGTIRGAVDVVTFDALDTFVEDVKECHRLLGIFLSDDQAADFFSVLAEAQRQEFMGRRSTRTGGVG